MCHVRRVLRGVECGLSEVRRRHLIEWLATANYAAETRRQVIISLRLFFTWLVHCGRLTLNPAVDLPAVARPRALPRPAADPDIMEAMQQAPEWVALAIEVMATCGLRVFETAKLRSGDVTAVGDVWTIHIIGKGGHARVVPCPSQLAVRLRRRAGWIFPGGQEGHVSAGWLGKMISRQLPDGVTAHTLRHRFASIAYRSNRDLRAVQALLGHASVATTQTYTSVDPRAVVDSAAAAWKIKTS